MKKLTLGLLCGGHSVEHEISLLSAKSVLNAINTDQYDIVLMGVDKQSRFILQTDIEAFKQQPSDPKKIKLQEHQHIGVLSPCPPKQAVFINLSQPQTSQTIDVIFPLIHGNTGEDGAIPGLLKLLNVPYVGSGITGCAITMDKLITKQLMKGAGLPTPRSISLHAENKKKLSLNTIIEWIGLPCFVKPANSGSSVGINKAHDKASLTEKIHEAFLYDEKILIEEAIEGRELECAILGNANPQASVVGEIITPYEFYSYQAKYLDTKGLRLDIPAKGLSTDEIAQIQKYAKTAFKLLSCSGMARVDFFMDPERRLYINELNTIPGFTEVSMYPLLWQASGLSYTKLIDRLIKLALDKHKSMSAIKQDV